MSDVILLRIVFGLLYLYIVTTGTKAEPHLWLDPPKVVVRYGDPVSVTCSTNLDDTETAWETPQGKYNPTGPKMSTWTVENVTEWGMKPQCYVNTDEHQAFILLSVTIYKTPDSVSISTVGDPGPMTEGGRYELQCDVKNVAPVKLLTVDWYKGDTLVNKTAFNEHKENPVDLSPRLQISPSRDDNGAQYRCEAKLDLGPEGPQPPPTVMSDPLITTVYYGPEVSCPSSVTVRQGEVFTPNCLIKGYPPPETTWYKEGAIADFSQPMDRTDEGQYNLIAINKIANIIHTLDIDVFYPPVSISELHNKTIDFGHDEVLKCSSDAKPRPQYRWEYNPEANVRTENIDGVSLLYIDYATGHNTGTYTCTAYNELGETSQSVRVDVREAVGQVSIKTVDHDGLMIENREYELICDIQFDSPVHLVNVSWHKGDKRVESIPFNSSTVNDSLSDTLRVSHNRMENGTQYKCKAQVIDEQGRTVHVEESTPLIVIVQYGPELACPSNVTVRQGEVFTPSCLIKGYPPPETTWYKEGVIVDFSQPMDRTDAGQYNLIAINKNANITHTLDIDVLYSPVSISELHNKTIDFGYDEVLKCSSDAKPHPQYRWEYNPEANVRTEDIDGVSLLYIDYATGHNTGTYKCTVSNELGETSQSVRVDVRGAVGQVSIKTVDHDGPMIEGIVYKLRCDIQFDFPVHFVNVSWYKGDEQVNSTSLVILSAKINIFDTLRVIHNKWDNGTQYKCKAEFITIHGTTAAVKESTPLSVIVHYKPVIQKSKLPPVVPVFQGYPEVLVCEAEGNPLPTITWTTKMNTKVDHGNLTINEATNDNVGVYNCTASNSVGTDFVVVKVIMKEDYLPLIAGFVALVVVITSAIFVVIYSIYYKNTKMGHYSVETAKFSSQNGNVAENGIDNPIPMMKLSQDSICV